MVSDTFAFVDGHQQSDIIRAAIGIVCLGQSTAQGNRGNLLIRQLADGAARKIIDFFALDFFYLNLRFFQFL